MINRRNFIKNCGIGLGVALTAPRWLDTLLAAPIKNTGKELISSYFGFSKEDIQKLLLIALSKGGDFSELFFEYTKQNSVSMEENLIKSSSEVITLGVGIRVIKGNNYGYAFSNELTFDSIKEVALTAAAIATGNSKVKKVNLNDKKISKTYYDLSSPVTDLSLNEIIRELNKNNKSDINFTADRISLMKSERIAGKLTYTEIFSHPLI